MKRQALLLLLAGYLTCNTAEAQQRSGARSDAPPRNDRYVDRLAPYYYVIGQQIGGAWWINSALMARLGITDDQKAQIERVFENHRLNLESNKAALEKEEAQLAQLLNAEPFDRNAALAQSNRVIQARSDLERENALMTLEMRERLTRAQWMQLPQPSVGISWPAGFEWNTYPDPSIRTQRGGGGRGARGQQ